MTNIDVGYRSEATLFLGPVVDYPGFGLKAGEAVRADELFARLAPLTRSYRDAPG